MPLNSYLTLEDQDFASARFALEPDLWGRLGLGSNAGRLIKDSSPFWNAAATSSIPLISIPRAL
jgi:hypothetical protein